MFLSDVDSCANYTVLSEADCAQGNALVTGWYRFEGAAGDRMPEKCVLMGRCGAKSPGWLNGKHPNVTEGVVTRQVCFSGKDSCYWKSNIIKVKNCSGFYVYELQRIRYASFRYCGNAGACKLHSFDKRLNDVNFKNVE